MAEREVRKRLAAILAADVAGDTRLMENDTDGTVAAWQDAREDVIKPCVADHSGKIVKLTGDGFLVEFPTVQDAVNCAIAMQGGLASSSLDSGDVYYQVRNRIDPTYEDMGAQEVKNVSVPVQAYAVKFEAAARPGPRSAGEKPSIALLPLNNLSGDAGREY